MAEIKLLRSRLDLSEEDISFLPKTQRGWVDLDFVYNPIEYYDLGHQKYHGPPFSRKGCLDEKVEPVGCGDPMSTTCFDGWDNQVAATYSRY